MTIGNQKRNVNLEGELFQGIANAGNVLVLGVWKLTIL